MKRKYASLPLSALLATSLVADTWTDPGTGIVWTYTTHGSKAYVGGGNGMTAISTDTTGSITVPSKIAGKTVTSVAYGAFQNCLAITNVVLPDSLTSISDSAFAGCAALQEIVIPEGLSSIGSYAFSGCCKLRRIDIPINASINGSGVFECCESLKDVRLSTKTWIVGESMFYGCTSLTNVSVSSSSDTIEDIGRKAFYGCSSLKSISFQPKMNNIGRTNRHEVGDEAFAGCSSLKNITLPENVAFTCIGHQAFSGCAQLTSLTIPDSVTNIGDAVCLGCTSLTNVIIGSGVKDIGLGTFSSCRKLSSVSMTDSVTNIGFQAFYNCTTLKILQLPSCLVSIDGSAFDGCTSLRNLSVPDCVTSIGIHAFRDTLFEKNFKSGLVVLGKVAYTVKGSCPNNLTIPDGVVSISGSLQGYEQLTHVTIPNSVKVIDDYAFANCGLSDIQIPDSVVRIGRDAFMGCPLKAVAIPDCVVDIGEYAFCGCESITNVVFGKRVERIGGAAFSNCGGFSAIFLGPKPDGFQEINWYANQVRCLRKYAQDYGIGDFVYPTLSDWVASNTFQFATGGDINWHGTTTTSKDGYESLRSGGIDKNQSSWLEATVNGAGRISFWWKASSEYWGDDIFDYAYLSVDGVPQGTWSNRRLSGVAIGGATDWTNVLFDVVGEGSHVIRWTYCKDEEDDGECGQDCVWLDEFSFTPRSVIRFSIGENVDGNAPEPIMDFAGTTVRLPNDNDFSWADHVFDGWTDGTKSYAAGANYKLPQSNVTLTAKWIAKTILSFDISEGTGIVPETVKVLPDTSLQLPTDDDFEWVDHVFIGWDVNGWTYEVGTAEWNNFTAPSSNVTLTAHWLAKSFVSFDIGDGTGDVPETMKALPNETVTLPTGDGLSLTDHVFNGWTDGAASYASRANYVVPGTNVTLKAIWIAKRFLTFTLDGGDGEIPIVIKDVPNATVTLPGGEGFHKAKHTFVGWSDGTQTYDPGAEYVVTDSSVEFTAVWSANNLVAPAISSADVANGGTIEMSNATIEITADSGTTIFYTLDGTEPTTNSTPYTAPFVADGMNVTVKAFAVKDDYFDSTVAEFTFSRKPYSAAECINAYGKAVSTGNDDTAWGRVLGDAARDGVAALRSGVIGEGGTSSVEMSVNGAGEIGFWWKTSCERVIRGQPKDHVAFYVDGVSQCWMGGLTDWSNVVISVSGEGSHVLKWIYQKDSNEKTENDDCAWLDEVTWVPTDPIPAIVSDSELAAVLAGTTDASLTANVTNVTQYAAYRAWALSVTNATTTAQTIKESTRTWLSYALGADALIAKELTSDDVKIESFTPASTDGKFEFTVSVKDVNIGGGSVAVETLKENLKKVLGIEGAATLSPGDFSSDNIDITFDTPVDGKARFTVSPPADAGSSFFMRVKVK